MWLVVEEGVGKGNGGEWLSALRLPALCGNFLKAFAALLVD